MIPFLQISGFLLLLGWWGYLVSTRLLRITHTLAQVGFTAVIGPAAAIVFANALGYVVPIQTSFLITIGCFLLSALALWFFAKPHAQQTEGLSRAQWSILIIVIVLAGFASARTLGSDPWCWTQSPLASTIAAGNFPVVEPMDPWQLTTYHYGPQFFAAFLQDIGASSEFAFGMQPLLGATGLVFCAASLAWLLTKSKRAALLGGILAIAGTGFVWLNGVLIIQDLYAHFVLHSAVSPFKSLVFLYGSNVTNPPFSRLDQRSTAMGFAFFYGLLLSLYYTWRASTRRDQFLWICASILIGAALALTMETGLAIILIASICFAALILLLSFTKTQSDVPWLRVFLLSLLVLIPTAIITKIQGGVFTSLSGNVSPHTFALTFSGRMWPSLEGSIPFWHWRFLRDFGLPLFLFPFAIALFWKQRKVSAFPLFLCIVAFGHLMLPLVIEYTYSPPDLNRVFLGATSMLAFIAALLLNYLWDRSRKWRIACIVALVCMLVSSTCYTLVRLTLPNLEATIPPLFETFPTPTAAEQTMDSWIEKNTTMHDYFYVGPQGQQLADCHGTRPQTLFMLRTGRFAITDMDMSSIEPSTQQLLKQVEDTCSLSAFHSLSIEYLVIPDSNRSNWFTQKCRAQDWKLVVGSGSEVPRLYTPAR